MKIIPRPECILTKSTDILPLFSFKQFPIYMGCVETNPSVIFI